jgi:hypothetical protein
MPNLGCCWVLRAASSNIHLHLRPHGLQEKDCGFAQFGLQSKRQPPIELIQPDKRLLATAEQYLAGRDLRSNFSSPEARSK